MFYESKCEGIGGRETDSRPSPLFCSSCLHCPSLIPRSVSGYLPWSPSLYLQRNTNEFFSNLPFSNSSQYFRLKHQQVFPACTPDEQARETVPKSSRCLCKPTSSTAIETRRQTSDLHLSFCLPRPKSSVPTPSQQQNTCFSLLCASSTLTYCVFCKSPVLTTLPNLLLYLRPQFRQELPYSPKVTPSREIDRLTAEYSHLLLLF